MLGLKYSITNKILNNLVEITRLAEEIAQRKVTPPAYSRIKRESLAKTAHYSTRIEGNPLTLGQVKSLLDGREVIAQRKAINEVQNYIRVLEGIESYQREDDIHMDGVLRIHRDITIGVLDNPLACGKLRNIQNYVVAGSRIIYTPPPPEKVVPMMEELVSWINSDEAKGLNPVIQAGICHYAMAMIHPFEDGNGRVARALAVLILRIRGFDEKGVFALDEYYEGDMPAYYRTLRLVDESKDLTGWLEYYTDGVLYSVKIILEVMRSLERSAGLNPMQRNALKHVIKRGYITNREYRKINGVSNKTAYQDLKEMVEKGVFAEEGEGRAKKYIIS
ncbi:MAG: Fic family protein [Candidatus Hydrothermarchaeota archaeon]|nr:Fic family protein [Candidatus Hydrothermarchaeota archaeon]